MLGQAEDLRLVGCDGKLYSNPHIALFAIAHSSPDNVNIINVSECRLWKRRFCTSVDVIIYVYNVCAGEMQAGIRCSNRGVTSNILQRAVSFHPIWGGDCRLNTFWRRARLRPQYVVPRTKHWGICPALGRTRIIFCTNFPQILDPISS